MGHNVSNAERRRNLLITRIGSLGGQGWILEVSCPRCGEARARGLDAMIERYGPDRLGSVITRLRCGKRLPQATGSPMRTCGAAPAVVVLRNRLHHVILVGPGALA